MTDESGAVVDRLTGPTGAGLHRVTWDLTYPAPNPVTGARTGGFFGGDGDGPSGPMVAPGTYRVTLSLRVDTTATVVGAQTFRAGPIGTASLPVADRAALTAFHRQTASLQRAAMGRRPGVRRDRDPAGPARAGDRSDHRRSGGPGRETARSLREQLRGLRTAYSGDQTVGGRQEPTPPTIAERVGRIVRGSWASTSAPTATHRRSYEVASTELGAFLPRLREAATALRQLEEAAERAGAPWTPGRIPEWRP